MGKSGYDVSDFSEAKFTTQKKRMRHGRVPRPCGRTKQTLRSSQAKSERVQILRQEYWQEVADIDLENLVFIDEMGVLLGLARTNARAAPGDRAYDFKPFYRGSKVSVIGAITSSKVLAVMTIDKSMNSDVFEVYISKLLVPQLWPGAVVVMDNLPAHKVETIVPLIEAVGAPGSLSVSEFLQNLIQLSIGGLS